MAKFISMLFSNILFLLVSLCRPFFVEISLMEKNESRNIKLVCGPPEASIQMKGNHTVLWQGSQFGNDEQEMLAERLNADALLVPNISVNSSTRHRCYLLTTHNTHNKGIPKKKRVSRDSTASIPVENGACPPGFRIDQDRCFSCFPGSYTSGQNTECFLCPKDFYMTKKAADSCWPCPEGKKTLAQGADSEDSCVYFDDNGNPVIKQSPPMTLIFSLVGVLIAVVWIVLIILLVRYCRESDDEDVEKGEMKTDVQSQTPLLPKTEADDHEYETISDYGPSDSDEHTYEEIVDFDDVYEDPIKAPQEPVYGEITSREGKLDALRKPSLQRRRESVDGDLYEIPRLKSTDRNLYEIPIQRSIKSDSSIRTEAADEDYMYDDIEGSEDIENDESKQLLSKSRSLGFEPATSSAVPKKIFSESKLRDVLAVKSRNSINRKPSSGNAIRETKTSASSADTVQKENQKVPQASNFERRSDDRMDSIPEQNENEDDMNNDIQSDEPAYDEVAESDSGNSPKTQDENESLE